MTVCLGPPRNKLEGYWRILKYEGRQVRQWFPYMVTKFRLMLAMSRDKQWKLVKEEWDLDYYDVTDASCDCCARSKEAGVWLEEKGWI